MRTVDRILATSDLHGQNERFLKLLDKMAYEPDKDLLIICGDLIDRGKENLNCLVTCEKLKEKGAILLKGNHEQFLEASLTEMLTSDTWRVRPSASLHNWIKHNGGKEMYEEIKDLSYNEHLEMLKFIRKLPIYFTVGNFIFTHAGANTRRPIEQNTEDELVWMKDSFPYNPAYSGKVIVFGHTPTWKLHVPKKSDKKAAKIWYDRENKDKIGIDCGGVFGGRLAVIELPSYREFYN